MDTRPSPSGTLFQRNARDKVTTGLATSLVHTGRKQGRKTLLCTDTRGCVAKHPKSPKSVLWLRRGAIRAVPDGEVKGMMGTGEQQWHPLLGATSLPCSGGSAAPSRTPGPPRAAAGEGGTVEQGVPCALPAPDLTVPPVTGAGLQGPVGTTVGA